MSNAVLHISNFDFLFMTFIWSAELQRIADVLVLHFQFPLQGKRGLYIVLLTLIPSLSDSVDRLQSINVSIYFAYYTGVNRKKTKN